MGNTNSVKIVEDRIPPITTVAKGLCTSAPVPTAMAIGNRRFEVMELPGHSPGSIGLWEKATGTLFSGDAAYDGPLLDMLPESDIAAYCRTMERLLDHPRVANEHARRVKKLENAVEHAYRQSLADLFQGPEDTEHIMHMLKCREVLRHLSNAADQGDKAADIVMDIGVKWS